MAPHLSLIKAAGVFGKRPGQTGGQRLRAPLPSIEKFEADFCAYLRRLASNDDCPPASAG